MGKSFYLSNSLLKDSPFTYKIYSIIFKFLEKLTCGEIFFKVERSIALIIWQSCRFLMRIIWRLYREMVYRILEKIWHILKGLQKLVSNAFTNFVMQIHKGPAHRSTREKLICVILRPANPHVFSHCSCGQVC